jgi:hypothetical protein
MKLVCSRRWDMNLVNEYLTLKTRRAGNLKGCGAFSM